MRGFALLRLHFKYWVKMITGFVTEAKRFACMVINKRHHHWQPIHQSVRSASSLSKNLTQLYIIITLISGPG